MIERQVEKEDIPQLERLWQKKGFECAKPDFSKLNGRVLVDDSGNIRMAILDRPTVELYMLIDQGRWDTPGIKWTWFLRLHEAERRSLAGRGIEDAHAWLPQQVRSFAHKLRKFLRWVDSSGPDGSWNGITRDV